MASMTALRPEKVCDSDQILCPKCGQVLRRVHAGEGASVVVRCEQKVTSGPANRFRDVCGQHVYVVGGEGYAVVFAITREEYEYLTATGLPRAAVVLTTLGVLRRRDVEHVPERECSSCHTRRKTFDMYDGVCRWCREDGQPNRVKP